MRKKTKSIRTILFSTTTMAFLAFVLLTTVIAVNIYVFTVGDILSNQIRESSKQVIANYENYFENAISVSNSIQNKVADIDISQETKYIQDYFDDIATLREEINSIAFYDDDGKLLVHDSKSSPTVDAKNLEYFIKAKEEPLINNFSKLNKSSSEDDKYYITISKYADYNKGFNNGVLSIDFDFTKIVKLMTSIDLGEQGHVVIYDKNYDVIYSSFKDILSKI